jgi:hypothetical protein
METDKSNFREYISKPEVNLFLSIIIPLLAVAITYGIYTARIDQIEKLVNSLQITYAEQQKTNEQIQVRLAELQKDVSYIRLEIGKRN